MADPTMPVRSWTWRVSGTPNKSGHRSQIARMLASRSISAVALFGALGAAACSNESVVTVDYAERFIGLSIPERAARVRAVGHQGRDEPVLLSFEADDRVTRDYAARLLGIAPMPGRDPGVLYLGDGVA